MIDRRSAVLLCALTLTAAFVPAAAAAPPPFAIVTGQASGWPEVRGWTADGRRASTWTQDGSTWPLQFAAYPTYEKGVRVAVADVTGDGRAEIVTAPGSDSWTEIEVFDGRSFQRLRSLPPWTKGSWWNGAYVAAGDTTGDGKAEVVVGLGPGCCTSLHVWDALAERDLADGFPFGNRSDSGARVAAGDVSGDGRDELLAVPVGGRRVSVLPADGGPAFRSFAPFTQAGAGAVTTLASGDLVGDARAEVVAAAQTPAGAQVEVLDARDGKVVSSVFPFGTDSVANLEVATGDLDGDGHADLITAARTAEGTRVRGVALDGSELASFYVLEPAIAAGASLAAGDLDGDGKAEIVLGSGPTTAPPLPASGPAQQVAVLDRTGATVGRFAAYPGRFQGPVRVAAGDLEGSRRPEIVTAPGPGTPAEIELYSDEWRGDRDRGNRLRSFLAFEPEFLGGATVAAGDLDGDGKLELAVGAGPGRAPEVRVFDAQGQRRSSFPAFEPSYQGGVSVAAGDLDADGHAELVVSTLTPPARIRVFGAGGQPRALFQPPTDDTGLEVAVADLDGDGRGEIVAAAGPGGEPWVQVLDGATGSVLGRFRAFARDFSGGVHVAAGDVDRDGRDEIVAGPGDGGDGIVGVYDRRFRVVRLFAPYPWNWPGVNVAVPSRIGLPLVALPRTVAGRTGAARTFVVAGFRDVAGGRRQYRASVRWGDGVVTTGRVRARADGLYDVLTRRRFARAGRYAAAVTFTGAPARVAVARSTVVVRRR